MKTYPKTYVEPMEPGVQTTAASSSDARSSAVAVAVAVAAAARGTRLALAAALGLLLAGVSSLGGGGCSTEDTTGDGGVSDGFVSTGTDARTDLPACTDPSLMQTTGCEAWAANGTLGKLPGPMLTEISGIVVSRKNPGVLWMHNDSGDTARVFAVSLTAQGSPKLLATYNLKGVTADDWEDIAIGPAPGRSGDFLYIGDVGDNFNRMPQRPTIQIYRIPEPTVDMAKMNQMIDVTEVERIDLAYPDGKTYDCEAILVDPKSAEIFLLTKNLFARDSYLFRAAPVTKPAGIVMLTGVGDCTGALRPFRFPSGEKPAITGADISAQGDSIMVRAYSGIYLWNRPAGESVGAALGRTPCILPMATETQGEAIGIAPDGASYYTVGEGTGAEVFAFKRN